VDIFEIAATEHQRMNRHQLIGLSGAFVANITICRHLAWATADTPFTLGVALRRAVTGWLRALDASCNQPLSPPMAGAA
jgi:hypothetical protein